MNVWSLFFSVFKTDFDGFELIQELVIFFQALFDICRLDHKFSGFLETFARCSQTLWNKNSEPVDGLDVIGIFINGMRF